MTRSFTNVQNYQEIQRPPASHQTLRSEGPAIMERESQLPPAIESQNTVSANIVITGGPEDGFIVPISSRGLTIGRLPDNDIVINEPWVSRKHAEILCIGSQHLLRDLSSSNGTFISDRYIGKTNHPLEDGDQIRFGRSEIQLTFRFSGAVALKMGRGIMVKADSQQDQRSPIPQGVAAQNTLASVESVAPAQQQLRSEPVKPGEELFEGEVRLNVSAAGDMRKMFQFVHELRKNSRLRVLRLARGAHQDIAIWLGLREQVPLKNLLSAMNCVSEVEFENGKDSESQRTFDIALSA